MFLTIVDYVFDHVFWRFVTMFFDFVLSCVLTIGDYVFWRILAMLFDEFSQLLYIHVPYGSRKLIIKQSGARAQNSIFESTLRTCDPHRFVVEISERTLRTCDPHPSTSKLWTGPKHVKVRPILIRIGAVCVVFRGASEYGTPVAIWEMLHYSKSASIRINIFKIIKIRTMK
jgi:hypothetical protein